MDKNNKVLTAQAKSFDNDSKLKMANIMADVWKVHHTNAADQAVPNDVNKLNASNIGRVIETAITGVTSA